MTAATLPPPTGEGRSHSDRVGGTPPKRRVASSGPSHPSSLRADTLPQRGREKLFGIPTRDELKRAFKLSFIATLLCMCWPLAAYAQDVAFAGVKKGFISIGRVVNEAPGMQVCADWLKTIVPEVPVKFISAGDPFWRPL